MRRLLLLLGLLLGLALPLHAQAPADPALFGDLQARHIGPAVMSGRISTLDAVARDRRVLWVGAAGGGVWKSTNGGTTFKPVFDDHPQSIGTLTIDQQHPDTVWVGTGEPWTRNSVSIGKGLYRTTDGGESWTLMGFEDSERIAKIIIDPKNADVVYVAVLGHLWDDHRTRGIYKTTDGGKTWTQILYVDEKTGAADLDMDPQEPAILYATMWDFRRQPWTFRSGGPGSAIYKTTDGGETWTKLTNGLPEGEKGRMALAVAPSRPGRLYAAVEAKPSALYRSDDAGANWTRLDSSMTISVRPFYFMEMAVDPQDYNRVYKPGLYLGISKDGGKSFIQSQFNTSVHSDHHAIWIDPNDPNFIYLGTDGGVYRSLDQAATFELMQNLPLSQFYHVTYDMAEPYNVYGGLQDNGTWRGPSQARGGVLNRHWENIGGGDGFHAFSDPSDPAHVYAQSQGGNTYRRHLPSGEVMDIRPQPGSDEPSYRWNWNAALALSPTHPRRIYTGAQFLFRSDDNGRTWEKISPDLTTNDPEKQKQHESGGLTPDNTSAENHTTIVTISESPLDDDVIWVGTDDGNVQLTRNGGQAWTLLSSNIPGLPPHTWVSKVAASSHQPGTAYATFTGHQTGDFTPYVYRTQDFGQTWTPLADSTIEGYAHVIAEDPVNPYVLYLGTEFGLFVSLDQGVSWARFEGNIPKVSIRGLAIHPREHDLLLATHGRGILVVDDLSPLRELTPDVLAADAALLPTRPYRLGASSFIQEFPGDGRYVGPNPENGMYLSYYLQKRHLFGELRVEVVDAAGAVVATMPGGKRKGINRVLWVPRQKPPKPPMKSSLPVGMGGFAVGPLLPPGTYTARLVKGSDVYEHPVVLVDDPTLPHSADDRAEQRQALGEAYQLVEQVSFLMTQMGRAYDQAQARADSTTDRRLQRELESFSEAVKAQYDELVASGGTFAADAEARLREKVIQLYSGIASYTGRPTQTHMLQLARLRDAVSEKATAWQTLHTDRLPDLNHRLQQRNLAPITLPTWDEFMRAAEPEE